MSQKSADSRSAEYLVSGSSPDQELFLELSASVREDSIAPPDQDGQSLLLVRNRGLLSRQSWLQDRSFSMNNLKCDSPIKATSKIGPMTFMLMAHAV